MQSNVTRQTDDTAYVAIVDDLELNRKVLETLAKQVEDVEKVKTFSSGETAFQAFIETPPDLIITDFSMPTMDAAVFIAKIRENYSLKDTPVIVVSANEKVENRRNALLCGATDFLITPVDVFEFKARVRNLLRLGLHQKILRKNGLSLKQELTETKIQSIKQVEASRERFTNVIDCVPTMIFAVNGARRCVFANEYCSSFFGDSPLEPVFSQLDGVNIIPETQPVEINIKNAQGKDYTFLMMSRAVPRSAVHEPIVVYSGIDVSPLKRTEQSLRVAKSEAEAANRAKSRFLANMSHEIRTPLNAIIGFSDMIDSECLGPVQNARYKEYIKDIMSSAEHLLRIIDEMLDLSQIERGQSSISIKDFNLTELIRNLRPIIEPQLRSKRNNLHFNCCHDFFIRSDSKKLAQVLVNVILNANKVMSEGVIEIEVRRERDGGIVIAVEDSGVGMTEDELVVALSSFGRIANPEIRATDQGVGLGLPISVGLMKIIGGRLEISSEKGSGTRVRLTLPSQAIVGVYPGSPNMVPILAQYPQS